MEKQVLRVLDQLSLHPDDIRQAVEVANATCSEREAGLKQQEEGLKTQLDALTSPIGKLVDVLKTVGSAGLAAVSEELQRLTDEKSLIEHELREVRQQLYELRRSTLDAGRTVEVIGELRLLYEAARPDERRELIRSLGWRSSASPTPVRRSRWSSSSLMGARLTSRARVRN